MSTNLELILVNFDLDLSHIERNGSFRHRFIVVAEKNKVLFYVAPASSHYTLTSRFNLKEPPVGSGCFYLDEAGNLFISNPSIVYGSISREAAQNLAFLIAKRLKELGRAVTRVDFNLENVNGYWNNKTFLNNNSS